MSAEKTKKQLIDITFDLLYKNGYCATSLMDILKIAQITKGSLYYHFSNKNDLVLSSMQNYIEDILQSYWIAPFEESDLPIETLIHQINAYLDSYADKKEFLDIQYGCPIVNFALDMGNKDEAFFTYFQSVYFRWEESMNKALQKAKTLKQTKTDFKTNEQALFIISSIEGSISVAKASNSLESLQKSFEVLTNYIKDL